MKNREIGDSKFTPGMPVRIKGTTGHHLNREYMPNGVTGIVIVDSVEGDKVFVAYRIP